VIDGGVLSTLIQTPLKTLQKDLIVYQELTNYNKIFIRINVMIFISTRPITHSIIIIIIIIIIIVIIIIIIEFHHGNEQGPMTTTCAHDYKKEDEKRRAQPFDKFQSMEASIEYQLTSMKANISQQRQQWSTKVSILNALG
jgi:hypothetical protein